MSTSTFNPFDPAQLAAFQQAQVSNANPGPSVPSSDTIGSPQQTSQIPQPSPSAPSGATASLQNGSQAQPGKGGSVKAYLMNFLQGFGDAALKEAGLPTEYEREQTAAKLALERKKVGIEQQNANTNEGYRQAIAGRYAAIPVSPAMEEAFPELKGRTDIPSDQFAQLLGKKYVADTGADAKVKSAEIAAKVKDRLGQAQLALRQALADRNYDMVRTKFDEISRYHNAELNLSQGRMDMAREALDYRETGPTAQTKTAGQFARTLTEKIPELKSEIDRLDAAGKLGPLQGRWNDFLAGKVGTGDPDYNNLRVGLSLFASGTARAHTSRTGIEAINYFKGLLAQPGATPAQIKSGLDAAAPYLEGYKKAAQWIPPNRTTTPATPPPASGAVDFSHLGGVKR